MTLVEFETDAQSSSEPTPAVERFAARLVQPPYEVVQGSYLTLDAAAGATTLVVEDGSDFDDSGEGGWLRLRLSEDADVPDAYVEYVTWGGDETDLEYVTLAAPLSTGVPAGTFVDVWDPVDLKADTSYEAVVVFDDAGSNAFKVDVKADAVDAFPQDVTLGRNQAVTLERVVGEDDIVLVRPDGDLVRSGKNLDRNTVPIPDGVVVDPDAPPETPPLVEAFGGIGSILLRVQETTVATDKIDLWTSTTSPVDTSGDPDDTMLGVSRAAHVIRRVEGQRVVAGTTYYIVAKARNVKGSSGPSVELAVTPSEATSEDLAVDSLTADMLLANNIIAAAIDAADLYAVRITGARIRTAVAGARCEIFVDDAGRGRIRFFDDFDQAIGAIQAISEGGTQRFTVGAAGPNAPRNRWWVDQFGNRYADVISDTFNVFGLIQGTNGLTLQLSPTVMKGFDGNSGVTRVLSSEGTTVVPHQVAGGGTVTCLLRGGNGHLFHVHAGSVTGTDITFQFRYRSDNTLAVNETVTFDWSITAYQR